MRLEGTNARRIQRMRRHEVIGASAPRVMSTSGSLACAFGSSAFPPAAAFMPFLRCMPRPPAGAPAATAVLAWAGVTGAGAGVSGDGGGGVSAAAAALSAATICSSGGASFDIV
jgi:hypothetical protein